MPSDSQDGSRNGGQCCKWLTGCRSDAYELSSFQIFTRYCFLSVSHFIININFIMILALMQALMGASIAALTIYDMVKAVSHRVEIGKTILVNKSGGKRNVVGGNEQ